MNGPLNGPLMVASILAMLAAALAGVLGWSFGRKRGARMARESAASRIATMSAERDAAERRARESNAESARWQGMSLAGDTLSNSPIFAARPAPRDAEELARMVRGLALVDDVVLADRSGYPLTRESCATSPDLAALAPPVTTLVRELGVAALHVTDIHIETAGAIHVRARSLTGRCEGAILVVQSTSQPVSGLVIDAVGHASARAFTELTGRPGGRAPWVTSDRETAPGRLSPEAIATLDRELNGSLAGVLLLLDGQPVFSSAHDGPSSEIRAAAAASLDALAARVGWTLRAAGVVRIEVALRDGQAVTWSSLPGRSRSAIITFGQANARSTSRLDVLVGRLRRTLETNNAPPRSQGTAA